MKLVPTWILATAGFAQTVPIDQFDTAAAPLTVGHPGLMIQAGGKVIQADRSSKGHYDGISQADLMLITDVPADHMDTRIFAAASQGTAVNVRKSDWYY